MKREEFIKIINKEFPPKMAFEEDFIGLQIEGSSEVKKVIVCLDLTNDIINQAIESKVDTIISHHPLFFGEWEELLKTDKHLQAKEKFIQKLNLNVFVIHTNADFNLNSIAKYQAKLLNLAEVSILSDNYGVIGKPMDKIQGDEFIKHVKSGLLLNYPFRTNLIDNSVVERVIIGSGASGNLIFNPSYFDSVFIIGEIKHHEWVYANENNIRIIEIGHFSEITFKKIISKFLKNKVKVVEAKEENGYKTI